MPGTVESLSFFDRVALLSDWTEQIVRIVSSVGRPMHVREVLDEASEALSEPTSEIKYALSYAESLGKIRIDNFTDEVSVTSSVVAA